MLRRTLLDELKAPNLKVNFDPANMLLYDMGDPIEAVAILGPDIRSVHVKDARRPTVAGQWGEEVPLGEGDVNIRRFVQALKARQLRRPPGRRAARSATRPAGSATSRAVWSISAIASADDLESVGPPTVGCFED